MNEQVRSWHRCQLIIQSGTTKKSGIIIQGWAAGSPDREWLHQAESHTARRISEAESMAVEDTLVTGC